jgi:hypothetical protein
MGPNERKISMNVYVFLSLHIPMQQMQGIGVGQSHFIHHDFSIAKVYSMQEKTKEASVVHSK